MSYSRNYKGIIWTNHALERLEDRNIPQELAWKAIKYPDTTSPGQKSGSQEFKKNIDGHDFTIIASQNNKREWIILSCWANPPFSGSIDIAKKKAYLKYKNSSGWSKFWIQLRKAFGFYEDF